MEERRVSRTYMAASSSSDFLAAISGVSVGGVVVGLVVVGLLICPGAAAA
jgi:hypothetical protein